MKAGCFILVHKHILYFKMWKLCLLTVMFLTGDVVLVSNVSEKRLQLRETGPGLRSASEAFQIVQVNSRTEDRDTNTESPVRHQTSVGQRFACDSPLVSVAEVRPEFRHTVQVHRVRRAIDGLTPPAVITQRQNELFTRLTSCLFFNPSEPYSTSSSVLPEELLLMLQPSQSQLLQLLVCLVIQQTYCR